MKYIRSLRQLLGWLRPMQLSLHSACTAFFLVLSLFPCMLLLLGLLRFTPLAVRDLVSLLEGLLPQALQPLAKWMVETAYDHASGTVLSVSAAAGLWSASRGMQGLVLGLGSVWGIRQTRGYFHRRAVSMVYTLGLLLGLLATVLLQVAGNALADFLLMTTRPGLLGLARAVDVEFLLLLLLLTGLFSGLYALLPARCLTFRQSLPGGVLAALGWLVSARLFSVYMQFSGKYASIYGSLYGLALGMLWLYFCVSLIFYGGALNRLIFEKKKQK